MREGDCIIAVSGASPVRAVFLTLTRKRDAERRRTRREGGGACLDRLGKQAHAIKHNEGKAEVVIIQSIDLRYSGMHTSGFTCSANSDKEGCGCGRGTGGERGYPLWKSPERSLPPSNTSCTIKTCLEAEGTARGSKLV